MNKQKRVLQVISIGLCAIMMCTTAYIGQPDVVQIEEEQCALGDSAGVLIEQTDADLNVIPDKYNTGVKGELDKVELNSVVNGIQFNVGGTGDRHILDFYYKNKNVSGSVVIENCDFSDYQVDVYHETDVTRNVKVIFNNCKFDKFTTGKEQSMVSFEFNNCTFANFSGSNAVFNNCMFGHSYKDGLVPFQNVSVNNCFFADLSSDEEPNKEVHSDGTQLYGAKDVDVRDVEFKNCRFEVPAINKAGSLASVNACIMLQIEYSNAKQVTFSDCIVNGGGFSLYAWDKNKGFSFENVTMENISVGCANVYGTFYPTVSPQVEIKNVHDTDSLYVSSVWKENSETHISVTNDTNIERNLLVYTDKGIYEYTIPACLSGKDFSSSTTYEDFPFDIDIRIPEDCAYVVCYDTSEVLTKQVRFVSWNGGNVYLSKQDEEKIFGGKMNEDSVLLSGKCGNEITFELTASGTLKLEGTGATYDYNTAKPVPWEEYISLVKNVTIGEGVTSLGTQIFRKHTNLCGVALPSTLTGISNSAFHGCTGLYEVCIPTSVTDIGKFAFSGCVLQKVEYFGTEEEWNNISIGSNNDVLMEVVTFVSDTALKNEDAVSLILVEGYCGKDVKYQLNDAGVLTLSGSGETYDYNSVKNAPWWEHKDEITSVVVEEGITRLGNQLFRKCSNLSEVDLPDSLQIIGCNVFISCKSLNEIEIPVRVTSIGKYAFATTNIYKVIYKGTLESWNKMYIGACNEQLINASIIR